MGGIEEAEVIEKWAEIVGERLASQAKAIAIEHRILFVRADDSAWRNELSLMKEDIVEKINDFFGEKRVSRIHLL
jgi:predicted nucleic acid-binding Zn ribbon protein